MEDGEVDDSDSDGEIIEAAPMPSLFPDIKPKPLPPPKPEMTAQQQARSTIPCRYFK